MPIKDKAKLKFEEVEVTFFSVDALIAMMEEKMRWVYVAPPPVGGFL